MTILARFAARHLRPTDTPACYPPLRDAGGCISGPALTTETPPNSDGLVLLQARRLVLLREAARLRNLRRSKQASTCEAELRAVTHRILGKSFPGEIPRC